MSIEDLENKMNLLLSMLFKVKAFDLEISYENDALKGILDEIAMAFGISLGNDEEPEIAGDAEARLQAAIEKLGTIELDALALGEKIHKGEYIAKDKEKITAQLERTLLMMSKTARELDIGGLIEACTTGNRLDHNKLEAKQRIKRIKLYQGLKSLFGLLENKSSASNDSWLESELTILYNLGVPIQGIVKPDPDYYKLEFKIKPVTIADALSVNEANHMVLKTTEDDEEDDSIEMRKRVENLMPPAIKEAEARYEKIAEEDEAENDEYSRRYGKHVDSLCLLANLDLARKGIYPNETYEKAYGQQRRAVHLDDEIVLDLTKVTENFGPKDEPDVDRLDSWLDGLKGSLDEEGLTVPYVKSAIEVIDKYTKGLQGASESDDEVKALVDKLVETRKLMVQFIKNILGSRYENDYDDE